VPIDYAFNVRKKLLVTRAFGAISDRELQECVNRIRQDGRFSGDLDQMGDYRGVTSVDDVTIEFLRGFGQQWQLLPGARRAYVAESPDTLAILRVLEVFTSQGDNEVKVFQSIHDAWRWLGRPLAVPNDAR
jgi:hypothetical protein